MGKIRNERKGRASQNSGGNGAYTMEEISQGYIAY